MDTFDVDEKPNSSDPVTQLGPRVMLLAVPGEMGTPVHIGVSKKIMRPYVTLFFAIFSEITHIRIPECFLLIIIL